MATPLWEWLNEERTAMGYLPLTGDDGNEVLSASRSGKHFHYEMTMLETSDEDRPRNDLAAQAQSGWQAEQELPISFIMSQNTSFVQAFEGAVRKEEASWNEWKPVRELSPQEAQLVKSDREMSRRILRSRMIYRDKNSGVAPLAPKARLVVTGFSDPDLASLR
eukprot:1092515-Amphidinium_carterae.1